MKSERQALINYLQRLIKETSGSSLSTQIEIATYRYLIKQIEQGKHLEEKEAR
jgi:hypothetical protein